MGEHQATIILEDASNNKLEQVVSYTVIKDTEPPKIIGASDKTVYIGESVSFRKGITVQDNKDDKVELNVDSTAVNLKKEGTYELIYSATDSSGNKTTRKVNVIVKKIVISEETVYQLADNVLAKITNDSMSKRIKPMQYINGQKIMWGTLVLQIRQIGLRKPTEDLLKV